MPADTTRVTIQHITPETNNVKTFTLTYADGSPIPYQAGQFVTLVRELPWGEVRRSYSISAAPPLGEPLAITVKRVENGLFSRYLVDTARVGDLLNLAGVQGMFTPPADPAPHRQLIFFAAGIGITPVFSIIWQVLLTTQLYVTLFYSARDAADACFYEVLASLAGEYADRFTVQFLFSSSFALARARLSKELIPALLREHLRVPVPETLAYLCGPFAYMRMVTYGLEEFGYQPAQLRREYFEPEIQKPPAADPPDQQPHQVTITRNHTTITTTVQYPETILRAARRAGLALPYSCETGRCGACVAQVTVGKCWMQRNEILTDKDIAAGKVLTCQAFPVFGDVDVGVY